MLKANLFLQEGKKNEDFWKNTYLGRYKGKFYFSQFKSGLKVSTTKRTKQSQFTLNADRRKCQLA